MGEAKNSFICLIKVCDINLPVLFPFAYDAISSPAIMPTIVTEIVQSMFRNPKSKRDFANALKEIPIASESDASDAESLDSEASSARSGASAMTDVVVGPREEYKLRSVELSRARDQAILKLEDDADEDGENHLLMLKQACLGADAVAGERNVIELRQRAEGDSHRFRKRRFRCRIPRQRSLLRSQRRFGDDRRGRRPAGGIQAEERRIVPGARSGHLEVGRRRRRRR